MSEMVERVAWALFIQEYPLEGAHLPDEKNFEALGLAEAYRDRARELIGCMREPSRAMRAAILDIDHSDNWLAIWHAMIDAGIK